jgi:hypothetical protein
MGRNFASFEMNISMRIGLAVARPAVRVSSLRSAGIASVG